ncbi:MAG: carboxypeptidase regulatory-like domain-containing protein, partial [Nanoarchaeota archaeon]
MALRNYRAAGCLIVFLIFLFTSLSSVAAQDVVGCCIDPELGCTEMTEVNARQICENVGGQFEEGTLCFEDPLNDLPFLQVCSTGCCCFDGNFRTGISREVCDSIPGTYNDSTDDCPAFCQAIQQGPGQEDDQYLCEGEYYQGYWCAEGDSDGNVISDPSDAYLHPDSVCYDAPCSQQVQSCTERGGTVCLDGEMCAGDAWLDQSQRCCAGECVSASCSELDGFWCNAESVCVGYDLTEEVMDYAGRTSDDQRCCFGTSPLEACHIPGQCQRQTDSEQRCNDGVDNDCDGAFDAADDDCSATISGVIRNKNTQTPLSGIPVVAVHQNGDVATGISSSTGFVISSVGRGSYDVHVDSSHYSADPQSIDVSVVSAGQSVSGLSFDVVLRSSGSFFGKVVDATGDPIEGASIRVIDTPYVTTTDALGNYVFSGLPTGKQLDVFAFKEGYQRSAIFSFQLSDGQSQNKIFNLSSFFCSMERPAPSIVSAEVVPGKNQIELRWSLPSCMSEVQRFKVFRCDGPSSECQQSGVFYQRPISPGSQKDVRYVDADLAWNKTYSYRIAALYPDTVFSQTVDVFTGDYECAARTAGDQFCLVDETLELDAGFYCDEKNMLRPAVDTTGYVVDCYDPSLTCSESLDSAGRVKASCVSVVDCAANPRASPFSMYFTDEICYQNEDGSFRPCYMDYSRTTVDSCFNCRVDMTCADYASEEACRQNRCDIIENGIKSDCAWELVDDELGTGVCIDRKQDLCRFCSSDQSRIFGGCSQASCSLLGDCFFVNGTADEPASCDACEDVTCYDYHEEASCMPGGSPTLDSSDNSLLSTSDDPCRNNNCRWQPARDGISARCVKDSNGNGKDDCGPDDFSYESSIYEAITCRHDRYAPNTSIVMPDRFNPLDENVSVLFIGYDAEWQLGKQVQEVRFCLQPKNGSRCQNTFVDYDRALQSEEAGFANITLSGLTVRPGELSREYHLVPGWNTLKFFSVDWSNNVEQVQEYDFYVDLIGPVINASYLINPKENEGPARSDVTIIATLDEPAKCSINLAGCDATGTCTQLGEDEDGQQHFLPEQQRTIHDVHDGIYSAEITCKDAIGNSRTISTPVIVDADPRAYNPQPQHPVDTDEVTISVDTVKQVRCKWTDRIGDADDFGSIPESHLMSRSRLGTAYRHTAQLELDQSKPYMFYAVCDYDPVSWETISFSLDQITPVLELQEGWGDVFDFSAWHASGSVYPVCTDEPKNGFGCGDTLYCLTHIESYKPEEEKQNCTPERVVEDFIEVDVPQRLCVLSEENVIADMGGKTTEVQCHDVLVDKLNPVLVEESFPTATSSTRLRIAGRLMDVHYEKRSWRLADVEGEAVERYVEDQPNTFVANFDLMADVSLRYNEDEHPIASILFRYKGPQQYYAATIDAHDPDRHVIRIQRMLPGLSKLETVAEEEVMFESGKKYPLSVRADDARLVFSYAGSKIEIQDEAGFAALGSGQVGAQMYKMGARSPRFSVQNIKLQDHDIYSSNTLFIKRNGHLVSETTTTGPFNISIPLSDGSLSHGQTFEFQVYGEDLADRASNTIQKTVYYDIEGPAIAEVTFVPLQNEDPEYVEYQTESKVVVDVSDEYADVVAVRVTAGNQAVDLVKDGENWEGSFPTEELHIGKHDVFVMAQDSAGNQESEMFEDGLWVDDRLNPVIQFQFDQPYRTSNLHPTLDIETTEQSSCTLQYSDKTRILRTLPFDQPGGDMHSVELGFSLAHEEGKNVKTNFSVTCTDLAGNAATKMGDIIVDLRSPIIAARGNDFDMILDSYDRVHKKYAVVTRSDRQLLVDADEPVVCRYDPKKTEYAEMRYDFRNTAEATPRTSDFSDPFTLSDGSVHVYHVSCQDSVGNTANQTRHVIFDVKRTSPARLTNIYPEGHINEDEITFSVMTMRDVPCVGTLRRDNSVISYVRTARDPFVHTSARYDDLADGEYAYSITCGSNPAVGLTTEEIWFVKDTRAPDVAIDSPSTELESNDASLSITFSADERSYFEVRNVKTVWKSDGLVDKDSSKTVQVPLRLGINIIRVLATDQAGNIGEDILYVRKTRRTIETNFMHMVDGAHVGRLQNISAEIVHPELASVDSATLSVYDSSGNVVPGIQQMIGDVVTYYFDGLLDNGTYYAEMEVRDMGNALVAYDATSFTIDTYAEEIYLKEPIRTLITDSPYPFSGTTDYQNLISQRNFVVQNTHLPVEQEYDAFTAKAHPAEGDNHFKLGFNNEIGHTAYLQSILRLDTKGPVSTIRLQGDAQKAFAPRPKFEVEFNEPARIVQAFVIPENGGEDVKLAVEQDYDPESYYLSYTFTMADDLPEDGAYQFALQTEDVYENVAATSYYLFGYSDDALAIDIVNPRFSVSPRARVNFTVSTNRPATCRYDTQNQQYTHMRFFSTSEDGHMHTVEIVLPEENRKIPYYVKCDDGYGTINEQYPAIFNLSFDTTPPEIDALFADRVQDGVLVEYPLSTRMIAQTDDEARCRYGDSVNQLFADMRGFDNFSDPLFGTSTYAKLSNLADRTRYSYYVICQNRAELLSSVRGLNFSVDLSQGSAIRLITPQPNSYLQNRTQRIQIRTNKRALEGTCKWGTSEDDIRRGFDEVTNDAHLHTVNGYAFAEGENTLYFECLIEGDLKTYSASFTIDNSPPLREKIDDGVYTYLQTELTAEFHFIDNESGISHYEYAIGKKPVSGVVPESEWASEKAVTRTSKSKVTVKGLNLTDYTNYYWAVRAFNRAGIASQWYASDGVTVDKSKMPVSGSCEDGKQNQDETDIDCGGLRCQPCGDQKSCLVDTDCTGHNCINNTCSSEQCQDGIQNGNESDVDCGGELCSGCALGAACRVNEDCADRYCQDGVCAEPSCSDGIMNGYETDVDCGGTECDACGTESMCVLDSDCVSKVCGEDGVCLLGSCTDGILNGNETDVDCGGSCDGCSLGSA